MKFIRLKMKPKGIVVYFPIISEFIKLPMRRKASVKDAVIVTLSGVSK